MSNMTTISCLAPPLGAIEKASAPRISALMRCWEGRRRSYSLQIFDQIVPLRAAEAELQQIVIVFDDVERRGEAAVMAEAALLVRPQPGQGRRPIHVGRRTVDLERVHPDLRGLWLRQLEILLAVADAGSMAKAAKENGLCQASLASRKTFMSEALARDLNLAATSCAWRRDRLPYRSRFPERGLFGSSWPKEARPARR
jgi:hypothetical protein